jgi:hypothetical protein
MQGRVMKTVPAVASLLVALVLSVALASSAHAAQAQPLGLPGAEDLLFSMQAQSGSLVKNSGRNYTLTLRGTAPRAVWFSDRPARDAGHVSTRALIGAWRTLGSSPIGPTPFGRRYRGLVALCRADDLSPATARDAPFSGFRCPRSEGPKT